MNDTVPWIRCCNVDWCDSTQVDEPTFMRAVAAIGEVFGQRVHRNGGHYVARERVACEGPSVEPTSRGVALAGRCGVCNRLLREVH